MTGGAVTDVAQAKSHGRKGEEEDTPVDGEPCDDLGEKGSGYTNLEKQGEGNGGLAERKK